MALCIRLLSSFFQEVKPESAFRYTWKLNRVLYFQSAREGMTVFYEQAGSKQTMSEMPMCISVTNCMLYLLSNGKPKQPDQKRWELRVFCLHRLQPIHVLTWHWVTGPRNMYCCCKTRARRDAFCRLLYIREVPWLILSWGKLWKKQWLFFTASELASFQPALKEHPWHCWWPRCRQRARIRWCHLWAVTYVKNQAGKHPRFCICSSNRADGLKEEKVWQRNVIRSLEKRG